MKDDANVIGRPYKRFYGKYRGKVLETEDPLFMGRILAEVAEVPAAADNFAMPCVPYAGLQVGFYNMPPIGANVWIEFEAGDPQFPIWSGCFWGPGELMVEFAETALDHVWKTQFMTIRISDDPEAGGITILCTPGAVSTPLTMTFNSAGITLEAPPATIAMLVEEGITLEYPPATIAMTEAAIEIAMPPTTVTLSEETVAVESPAMEIVTEAEFSLEAGAELTLASGAALELTAGAELALTAGAALELSAAAEMALTSGAAMEITTVALEITGATNVVPALLIDGQPPLML